MKKVAVYFINNVGEYFIHHTVLLDGTGLPPSIYVPSIIVDETTDMFLYKVTQKELAHPTTKDGGFFVVIAELEERP